jgi:hypothetical protein
VRVRDEINVPVSERVNRMNMNLILGLFSTLVSLSAKSTDRRIRSGLKAGEARPECQRAVPTAAQG